MAWLVSLGAAVLSPPLRSYLDHVNIVTLFLLAVVGVAARYGRGPAVLMAVLNVLSFNFAFMPPHFAFSFETLQSILTFAVMLSVGLIVGQLTARFRYQAQVACVREARANNLYALSRELSGALVAEEVIEISERCVEASFPTKARLLLPDDQGRLQPPPTGCGKPNVDVAIAQWCFDCNASAGFGADTESTAPLLYLPLKAPLHTRGVIVVGPEHPGSLLGPEQRQLLDTFAVLIAVALERLHFVRIARDMSVKMEAERERHSLLAGLSHDLRTPMTALIGLTETLALELPAQLLSCQESLAAIREQAVRMGLLVDNLLDMAKLQATGGIRLRKDWQSLEELVGSAVRMLEQPLCGHPLRLTLDPELPLVDCDPVLIERVLVNLLQNAAKYTPPGAAIGVSAGLQTDGLSVEVWDEGPGLPAGCEQNLFEKFTRGHTEWATPGVGLGLAICRAIVEAHGGHIRAENRLTGGACFIFSLPLATPPLLEIDDEPDPHPI